MGDGLGRFGSASLLVPGSPDALTILSMMERAAVDPACDLERLDRLVEVYERALRARRRGEFAGSGQAAARAAGAGRARRRSTGPDGEVRRPTPPGKTPSRRSGRSVGPARLLAEFQARPLGAGRADRDRGASPSRAGTRKKPSLELPVDATATRTPVQAVGSTMSYGQRYVARMLLNLVSRGEDDDGGLAGQSSEAVDAIVEINQIETEAGVPGLEAAQPGDAGGAAAGGVPGGDRPLHRSPAAGAGQGRPRRRRDAAAYRPSGTPPGSARRPARASPTSPPGPRAAIPPPEPTMPPSWSASG